MVVAYLSQVGKMNLFACATPRKRVFSKSSRHVARGSFFGPRRCAPETQTWRTMFLRHCCPTNTSSCTPLPVTVAVVLLARDDDCLDGADEVAQNQQRYNQSTKH
mmetsp:Transcript_39931/g.58767  ORF Transcript_39931/g.58767 Transcript_39931/m.58767 type:complete len:105 (-) Transcript_39931:307-621(-)